MTIHIILHGDPGHRTGRVQIGTDAWELVTWHKQADGHVQSTTSDGEQVTLAVAGGKGGIGIGARWWYLFGCVWMGAEMTGRAVPGVTDEELGELLAP